MSTAQRRELHSGAEHALLYGPKRSSNYSAASGKQSREDQRAVQGIDSLDLGICAAGRVADALLQPGELALHEIALFWGSTASSLSIAVEFGRFSFFVAERCTEFELCGRRACLCEVDRRIVVEVSLLRGSVVDAVHWNEGQGI